MKIYCNATGLPYSDDMLTWKPRELPWMDFPHFDAWHGKAMNSTGFIIRPESPLPHVSDLLPKFQETVIKALPYFEAFQGKCKELH